MRKRVQRWGAVCMLSFMAFGTLSNVATSAPETSTQRLSILASTSSNMNQQLTDFICLSYELEHPFNECHVEIATEPISRKTLPTLQQYDFIILSEQVYNAHLTRDFELLFPLYEKSFTAIARTDREGFSGIFNRDNTFGVLDKEDQFERVGDVFNAAGLPIHSVKIDKLSSDELAEDFCHFDLDVVFVMGTHPDPLVRKLNTLCDGQIVPIASDLPPNFFQRNRYLYKAIIDSDFYWRTASNLETLSERYYLAYNRKHSAQSRDKKALGQFFKHFFSEVKADSRAEKGLLTVLKKHRQNSQSELSERGKWLLGLFIPNETIVTDIDFEETDSIDPEALKSLDFETPLDEE